MTINTTTWHPDTCITPSGRTNCGVTYNWDTEVDPLVRVHTLNRVLVRCPAHASLSDTALFATLFDENRRKNISINIASATRAGLEDEDITWVFTGQGAARILEIDWVGKLSAGEISAIQAACNLQFGPNKVVVI